MAHMPYGKFVLFDALGDITWAVSITLLGYWFGTKIPDIDHYILLAVGAVMIITLGPTLYHLAKAIILKRRGENSDTN
jgi:membrane-associated protein